MVTFSLVIVTNIEGAKPDSQNLAAASLLHPALSCAPSLALLWSQKSPLVTR